ncbi:MAG TPA: hypothetical protein VE618_00050 [Myxococcaceae bacterium]|nr:hypothetical protein [Myxococcaceae bacterium]
MPHRFLIALLAFGVIAGYASGFASLAHRHHWRHRAERGCVEERGRSWAPPPAAPTAPPTLSTPSTP